MKNLLLFCMLLSFPFLISSQDICSKWSFGMDFNYAQPLEDLEFNGFGKNYGANLDLLYHGGNMTGIRFQPGFRLDGGISSALSESVIIDLPGDPLGTDKIRNYMVDLKFLGRLVSDQNKRFSAYMEGFVGLRVSGAYSHLALVDADEFDQGTYDNLTSGITDVMGFGGGILIKLTQDVDLNFRAGIEKAGMMSHYNVVSDTYPSEAVRTGNGINASFGIGLLFHFVNCEDDKEERCDRGRSRPAYRQDYIPQRRRTTPLKVKKTVTSPSKTRI